MVAVAGVSKKVVSAIANTCAWKRVRKITEALSGPTERVIIGALGAGLMVAGLTAQWHALPRLIVLLVGLALLAFALFHGRSQRTGEVLPPGGGIPLVPPIDYQVNVLRQVIARTSESTPQFDLITLQAVTKNLPRTGTDPIYEPLDPLSCEEGFQVLIDSGELENMNPEQTHSWGPWKIPGS